MNVTNKNFNEFYSEIKEVLPQSEFISIDLEMTGIQTEDPTYLADLPFERYLKLRSAASKFRIIQVGLCAFIKTGENRFEARPYNVYVFPRISIEKKIDIVLEQEAIQFNSQYNMDWNKWFYEAKAQQYKESLCLEEDIKESEVFTDIKLVRDYDIMRGKDFKEKLEQWIASDTVDPLVILNENSFFRQYIINIIRTEYPKLYCEEIRIPKHSKKSIRIYKFPDFESREEFLDDIKRKREKLLIDSLGFTRVFELLLNHKTKIIGQNCLFDLMFIYSHFLEPLPGDYLEFKRRLAEIFPIIYDTKFIANNTKFHKKIPIYASSLNEIASLALNKEDPDFYNCELILPERFKDYDLWGTSQTRYHEAGYDALVTGFILIRMFYILDEHEKNKVQNSIFLTKTIFYIKNGSISHWEPWYKELEMYFNSGELFKSFDQLGLKDYVKFSPLGAEKSNKAIIILDSKIEEHKTSFHSFCDTLKDHPKLKITPYKDYSVLKLEHHEKNLNQQ